MILSVSRRTDIPALYSDWFFHRMQEGFVLVPNPMNPQRISRIPLSPEGIDCIVFWSKYPEPLAKRLGELHEIPCYFQYSLNAYGTETEKNLPPLEKRLDTFVRLSGRIGPERVIWRYDPIILSGEYSMDDHAESFAKIARHLHTYTRQCIISFVDVYRKMGRAAREQGVRELEEPEMTVLAKTLAQIGRAEGIQIKTCAEKIDLSMWGIEHAHCIDEKLISGLIGRPIRSSKDKNQREECGCAASVDIGTYNTCTHGCSYCYANFDAERANRNFRLHDPESPMLIGHPKAGDAVFDKGMKSQIDPQTDFFTDTSFLI